MTITLLIQIIAGVIFAVIGFLIKSKISDMETDIKNLQDENKEIVENYIDRFEKLNKNINVRASEIIDRFHAFEIKILEKLK